MCGFVRKSKLIECQSQVGTLERTLSRALTEREALLARLNPPAPPEEKGTITADEVRDLLLDIFPSRSEKIFLLDSVYEITAKSEMRRFIEWDNTNIFPYGPHHDCDKFALALSGSFAKYPGWSGFPARLIWTRYPDWTKSHAYFIEVAWPSFDDRTPAVFFVEPQNDWEIAEETLEQAILELLVI